MEPLVRLEMTAEPAFASDESGRIVSWNTEAESLLGYAAAEVLGRPCCDVIQGSDVFGNPYCGEQCYARRLVEHGGPIHGFEMDVRKASGERIRAAFSLFVVRGGPLGAHTIVHLMRPVPAGRTKPQDAGEGEHVGQAPAPPADSVAADGETAPLSNREIEVLKLVSDGVTTQEIALALSLSTATIRTHVQNILRKLGAHSKLEAVAVARRHRLI